MAQYPNTTPKTFKKYFKFRTNLSRCTKAKKKINIAAVDIHNLCKCQLSRFFIWEIQPGDESTQGQTDGQTERVSYLLFGYGRLKTKDNPS